MDKKLLNKIILVGCIICFAILLIHQHHRESQKTNVRYDYLLYLPESYQTEQKKEFPLIIYLHGASLRGSNLNLVKKYGLPHLIDKGEKFDFIIASPQCPEGLYWDSENWFDNLYTELTSKYRIDINRIYLTGMSMGGFGTWNMAMKYPDKFAAIVPLCGGGNNSNICRIRQVPVWAFHGTKDSVVPIRRSKELVKKLRQCGGDVKFSQLKGKGHAIQWVYEDQQIYIWMLEHSRNHVH